ncbi:MAG: toxin co-regulated pilus biosynthesis Q family protein, partial [Lysobacter sp.]
EQDLAIELDWARKHLYVGKRQYKGTFVATAPTASRLPVAAKPIPYVPAPVWKAKTGDTVRTTVEDWARREGWALVWPMVDLDYRIVAALSFDGSLVDATSKLTRLYESADRPLAVDIHVSQKLIVFSERNAQ